MLWAALLLASASPTPEVAAGTTPLELAATARTFQVEVGRATVTLTVDVAAVARPTRVPVRVQARHREHTAIAAGDPPLSLYVCDDLRCTLRSEVVIPLDNQPVMVEASLFPTGLALTMRHMQEQTGCCGTSTYGVNSPVIATTAPSGMHMDVLRDGTSAGAVVVPVGETLAARPSLLNAYSALVVMDEGWHIGGLADPRDEALREFVARGGIASVPSSFFDATVVAGLANVPAPPAVEVVFGGGPSHLLRVPTGTKMLIHDDGGVYVVRPFGASREEQVAGLVAARPSLLQWTNHYGQGDSIPARAVGAGLATRPHRGVAFFVGFACVVGIAACMRSSRRRGWRAALWSSTLVSFAGLSALWLVERASMPSELHERVVAWVGPNAAWEIGVDAVRPRATGEVTVESPIPPVMATVLGADTAAREPQRSDGVDANGHRTWRVTSTVGSSSALAVMWERPAMSALSPLRNSSRPPVEMTADGTFINHLDVPLRAISINRGSRVSGALAPHASRSSDDDAFVIMSQPDDAKLDLTVMEQRLLHEIGEACISRLGSPASASAGSGEQRCAAAIAVLDDGTLLGIEVSQ